MKVLVLGSSGIIGQHMRLCVPDTVQPVWFRQKADLLHCGIDELPDYLGTAGAVINLAGESRPDVVETDPLTSRRINVAFVDQLAHVCATNGIRMVQVSTQAVFDGDNAPYSAEPRVGEFIRPVNEYGRQKLEAERVALSWAAIVARPTFCLGVRPLPHVGRMNPVEQILSGQVKQVADRWFSVSFAHDVARELWALVTHGSGGRRIVHLGIPRRLCRLDIARELGVAAQPVNHEDFPGLAPRPIDTTYAADSACFGDSLEWGIRRCLADWQPMEIEELATEISLYLGLPRASALVRLQSGFGTLHNAVTEDFKRANPRTDDELLAWYRATEAYIWELAAYHCDGGFNYAGMCKGIADRLKQIPGCPRVLVLGDGIGTMTIALKQAGIDATYHDLAGSKTAGFAALRYWRRIGEMMPQLLTAGWAPELGPPAQFDAVVSADFFEHVTDVPAWTAAAQSVLKPGGVMLAQNAFAIGSGDHGSMPMHLARNDRYESEWRGLLLGSGWSDAQGNWWAKCA